jgi:hypothetical protein
LSPSFRGTAGIVDRERRLEADKGIGRLTLAVESESGAGEVVSIVATKTKMIIFGGKRRLFSFVGI